jgi:hypothetical protein
MRHQLAAPSGRADSSRHSIATAEAYSGGGSFRDGGRLFAANPVNYRTARPWKKTLSKGACHAPRQRGKGEGELISRQAYNWIKQALPRSRQPFNRRSNFHASTLPDPVGQMLSNLKIN